MKALAQLVTALEDHFALRMSREAIAKLRGAFSGVGPKNQDDFASAVFLEALQTRASLGRLGEDDVVRAGWRIAKQLCRDATRTKTIDPSILSAVVPSPEVKSETIPAEWYDLAKNTDAVGAAIFERRSQGRTLSQIADELGLPLTTVWEKLQRVIALIRKQL